jgi:hypothetical protein
MVTDNLNVNNLNVFAIENHLTIENIREKQLQDENVKSIIEKLNEGHVNIKENYFIDSHTNIVMKRIKPRNLNIKDKSIQNKILIPKSLIKHCLEVAHTPHFGSYKTYEFLRQKYYWINMYKDVANFCKNCIRCMKAKPKAKITTTNLISKKDLSVGELLAIDAVGPLPRSIDNKMYIITIIDHYSKYLEAIPVPNIKSQTVIKVLDDYFSKFGISKIVLSDNGSNFTSQELEKYFKDMNIEHRKSSVYYPQSNGLIERVHRTLKESITALTEKVFNWTKNLLIFKLYYNNSKHLATLYTPAEVFFGRSLRLPLNVFDDPKFAEDLDVYVNKVKELQEEIKKNIEENENKYINIHQKYIKGRSKPNLRLGDHVFLKIEQNKGVFQDKYSGPWEIEKIFRNDNYLIKNLDNNDEAKRKIHVSKIFLQKDWEENN